MKIEMFEMYAIKVNCEYIGIIDKHEEWVYVSEDNHPLNSKTASEILRKIDQLNKRDVTK